MVRKSRVVIADAFERASGRASEDLRGGCAIQRRRPSNSEHGGIIASRGGPFANRQIIVSARGRCLNNNNSVRLERLYSSILCVRDRQIVFKTRDPVVTVTAMVGRAIHRRRPSTAY